MNRPWHATRYRANLIDMHIPDWDAAFLADFDARACTDCLVQARVEVAYLYASSCLGICYWPTRVRHPHAALKGRDLLGERIDECHRRGLDVDAGPLRGLGVPLTARVELALSRPGGRRPVARDRAQCSAVGCLPRCDSGR